MLPYIPDRSRLMPAVRASSRYRIFFCILAIGVLFAGIIVSTPIGDHPALDSCFSGVSPLSFFNLDVTSRAYFAQEISVQHLDSCFPVAPDRAPPLDQTIFSL